MNVEVAISNRHVHLNKEDLETLFGSNYELKKRNDLSQKGEFACIETVCLETIKNRLENVHVLGPIRNYTQVEISKTDSYFLGINPPVRDSGDLLNSEIITIIGPVGKIKKNCCIIANRHIHVPINDNRFNDKEKVSLKIDNEKGGILYNVFIKKKDTFVFEAHLDTDDANAFNLKNKDSLEIIKK